MAHASEGGDKIVQKRIFVVKVFRHGILLRYEPDYCLIAAAELVLGLGGTPAYTG
jgi:hypothetical protein